MESRKHITDLHAENMSWMELMAFYKDQIDMLNKLLGDTAHRYTDKDIAAQVEQLQNQLIRQREVLDELKHEIRMDDSAMAINAQDNPVASNHRLFSDHPHLRDKVVTYEKLFAALKSEFDRFLSKNM